MALAPLFGMMDELSWSAVLPTLAGMDPFAQLASFRSCVRGYCNFLWELESVPSIPSECCLLEWAK